MITRIEINGFKSFHNFEMVFTPLTMVAGANASGKSNLFDALKLLSDLAGTDLKTAFNEQRGHPSELFTQYDENRYASEICFGIEMLVNRMVRDNWGGEVELNHTRMRYELTIITKKNELGFDDLEITHESLNKIAKSDDQWVKEILAKKAKPFWETKRAGGSRKPFIRTEVENGITKMQIRQDGSHGGSATPANAIHQTVLSGINSVNFPHAFAAKQEMQHWQFLQLNPEDLREPTRQDVGLRDTITSSGKNLAAALYRIKHQDEYSLKDISRRLNSFLPNFIGVNVYDDRANRQFIIKLKGQDGKEFSSRVLSEGTLRLLAFCILEYDDKHTGLLCFEEPENGIHPARIRSMARLLKNLSMDFIDVDMPLRQVIVNTHSPLLVSELLQWQDDPNVTVWLSMMNTLVTDIEDKRIQLKITKMNPVSKKKPDTCQLSFLPVTEVEHKFTLNETIKYLQTADPENAIQKVNTNA